MGKVIGAVSGKGGVGKTTFITNLAATLAERGLKIIMVDMNMGLRNLDIYMGLENRTVFDVADVLTGVCSLKKALVKDKRFQELYLLSGVYNKEKFVSADEDVEKFYKKLKQEFDYVLVDGPSGINKDIETITRGMDIAVIIATPEYVALRDADMIDRILYDSGVENRVYLVNKMSRSLLKTGMLPTFEEMNTIMKVPLLGIIQYDNRVMLASNSGTPAVMQEDSPLNSNYRNIVNRLLNI